jgi:hypothetical protein
MGLGCGWARDCPYPGSEQRSGKYGSPDFPSNIISSVDEAAFYRSVMAKLGRQESRSRQLCGISSVKLSKFGDRDAIRVENVSLRKSGAARRMAA